MSKLRFILDENANRYKPGDRISGSAETTFATEEILGIYITTITKEFDLIATWRKAGKIKRKQYVQVYNTKKTSKPKDAPKDLLKYAKKHSMWI